MKDKMKILIRLILILTICSFTCGVCIWADSYSSMLESAGVVKDTFYVDSEKLVPSMIIHKLEDDGWRWSLVSMKEMAKQKERQLNYIPSGICNYVQKRIYLINDETLNKNYDEPDIMATHVFCHEVGHAIANYLDDSDLSDEFKEIYCAAFDKEYISPYQKDNNCECYAEAFRVLTIDQNTVLEKAPKLGGYVLRDVRTMMEMR
ncbi:MAG: hypothetical protein J5842_01220 [Lachnospiraceae bacterium]|nr:hypothetical protein [Lachnospiraceae bacterium]